MWFSNKKKNTTWFYIFICKQVLIRKIQCNDLLFNDKSIFAILCKSWLKFSVGWLVDCSVACLSEVFLQLSHIFNMIRFSTSGNFQGFWFSEKVVASLHKWSSDLTKDGHLYQSALKNRDAQVLVCFQRTDCIFICFMKRQYCLYIFLSLNTSDEHMCCSLLLILISLFLTCF